MRESDILGTASINRAYQLSYFYDFLPSLYLAKVRRAVLKILLISLLFTYFLFVLVSGGIFLVVVFIPFAGYKFYKKFLSKWCSLPSREALFRCRRRVREGQTGNFLRKRIVPRVELELKDDLRVGDAVSFKIMFPLSSHRTLEIVQNGPDSLPSVHESITLQEDWSLEHLSIDIVKMGGCSSSTKVVPIQEMLPRRVDTATVTEDVLLVKFAVQESGFYQIFVVYEEQQVPGSPFPIPFNAGEVNAEKCICLRQSPIIVSTSGEFLTIFIKPADRYGNECNFGDVHPELFHFSLFDQNKTSIETLLFSFTRELVKVGEEETLRVKFEAELFLPGLFHGVITYDGILIHHGSFDLSILLFDEYNSLRSIMTNNPSSKYHEAKLWKGGRTVYIYIAAKTVTVKEFYFAGLIPFRLATFRVLPATKMRVTSSSKPSSLLLTICEPTQPQIVLEINEIICRTVVAMFALFLKQRLGGSECFENKQKFFYEELKAGKDVEILRNAGISAGIVLNINRAALVNSTLQETKTLNGRDWCRNFKIKFIGEEGSDDGGLRREWLNLLCKEMFGNNVQGMFCSMGNSRLVHPNPLRDSTKWTLKHYELAGKIVGKCLFETAIGGFNKQMVNARFSRSFLGQLIGYAPHFKYFEQDDPELFMTKVRYLLENDAEPMELTFTEEEYDSRTGQLLKTVELRTNGKKEAVKNENKTEYLNLLAQYRLLTRVKREIEAFLKGLAELVPDGLLTNFDENELEILMCGRSTFSVEDLKANHVVSAEGPPYNKILSWFFTAVQNMTDEERGRLLQFTTGSSLLPHGGFKSLQPKFRITVNPGSFGKLPLAHTCFSEICLSIHRNFEEFERTLKIAINEGSEGFAII